MKMFDGFSLKNCLPSNAIVIKKPLNSNDHHYSIGRPEWQSNYTTEARMKFTEKDLRNNKADLNDKPYLFPNHSNFELAMTYNNKNVYKTTNKMDYIPKGMTKEEQEEFQKKFIEYNPNILLDKNLFLVPDEYKVPCGINEKLSRPVYIFISISDLFDRIRCNIIDRKTVVSAVRAIYIFPVGRNMDRGGTGITLKVIRDIAYTLLMR